VEGRIVRALLVAGLVLTPALAAACTSCARDSGRYGQLLVAGMALFPFAVAGVVAAAIRRTSGAGAEPEARS